jgi:hypothetical protein
LEDAITGAAPGSRGGRRGEQRFDLVDEAAVEGERGEVLVRLADRLDHRRAGARPGHADDVEVRGAIGERCEQALDRHAVLAIEDPRAAERRIGEFMIEQEERVSAHWAGQPLVRCDQVTLSTFHVPFSRTRSKWSTPQCWTLPSTRKTIGRPDHRDIAVDLDRGIGDAFLELLRARLDAAGKFGPAQVADAAAAVGLLDRDGSAALGAELRQDRGAVTRGEAREHRGDRGQHGSLLRAGRGKGGALHDRCDRGDLGERREGGEEGEDSNNKLHCGPFRSSPS